MEPLLSRIADEHFVPGVAAAAVADGRIVQVAAHGWRDLGRRLPMTIDTPSRWYSISKPLTSLVVARLVAAGKLSWDRPVSQLVPAARFADPVATERATIADCVLHRTGLISGDWTWVGAPSEPAELLRRLPHVPCRPGFRLGHYYQNLHFTILGEALRAVGSDWHSEMRKMLAAIGVRPLTRLAEFVASDRALGYGPNGLSQPHPAEDFDFEGIAPASAVCGSVTDLARVAQAVALGGRELVSRQEFAHVTRPVLAVGRTDWPELRVPCAALAGRTVVYRGELALQWAGGFTGYTAHLVAIPERRIAGVGLCNRSASPAAEALAWSMLDHAAGWEALPWADRFLEQKKRNRQAGQEKLAARLARPAAPWPDLEIPGRYVHGGYGELTLTPDRRLLFRNVELPLVARPDGTLSADGSSRDFAEICWDLRPVIEGGRMVGVDFGPDDPSAACRFTRA